MIVYSVRVGGVEVFSTTDELTAYAYKNLCEGSTVIIAQRRS